MGKNYCIAILNDQYSKNIERNGLISPSKLFPSLKLRNAFLPSRCHVLFFLMEPFDQVNWWVLSHTTHFLKAKTAIMNNLMVLLDRLFQFFFKKIDWTSFTTVKVHSLLVQLVFKKWLFGKVFQFRDFFGPNFPIVNKYVHFIRNQSCSFPELPTAVQLFRINATYFCFSKLLRSGKNFAFSSCLWIQGSVPLKPIKTYIVYEVQ